ncbi:MAG: dephospho-CoA kinase [Planctomycetaceae bacterium]
MSDSHRLPVVGIVGGIGSGKSAVCRQLTDSGRFAVINGDDLGHQALNNTLVRFGIRKHFGDSVFDETGSVNRAALGRRVFGPEEQNRLDKLALEKIVHPYIREGIVQEIEKACSQPQYVAVLLDAAVLFEAGWNDLCDAVVYIDVPDALRLERVVKNRGWNAEELRKREASQLGLAEKKRRADFTIDNSGSITEAGARLQDFILQLR